MIWFFDGWLVVCSAVFSFLLLFCVSSDRFSVHLLMQKVQKRQRIRRSRRHSAARGCSRYRACTVYRLYDVWGWLSSQKKEWERQRGIQQCCVCLHEGVIAWRWDPDQTNPIRFQEGQRYQQRLIQEKKVIIFDLVVPLWSQCVTPPL